MMTFNPKYVRPTTFVDTVGYYLYGIYAVFTEEIDIDLNFKRTLARLNQHGPTAHDIRISKW